MSCNFINVKAEVIGLVASFASPRRENSDGIEVTMRLDGRILVIGCRDRTLK